MTRAVTIRRTTLGLLAAGATCAMLGLPSAVAIREANIDVPIVIRQSESAPVGSFHNYAVAPGVSRFIGTIENCRLAPPCRNSTL